MTWSLLGGQDGMRLANQDYEVPDRRPVGVQRAAISCVLEGSGGALSLLLTLQGCALIAEGGTLQ